MFEVAVRDRWARLMALPKKVLSPPPARAQAKGAPAEHQEERPDPKVASACHQLGLVAQALGHSDAAEGWHVEALRTAARLKDYGLCARSAHQLAELCERSGRQDEAAGWSALSLASMAVASGRAERPGLQHRQALAGRIRPLAVARLWRGTTGRDLPARLRALLNGWLEDALGPVQAAAGSGPEDRQAVSLQRLKGAPPQKRSVG